MSNDKLGFAFTLKGEGIDFKGDVNQATARALLNVALGGDASSTTGLHNARGEKVSSSKLPPTSLREFLNAREAKRIPEKIVAIAEYLTANGAADFSKDDVLTQFRVAREAMPGNFHRDFSWAIAAGWISEDSKNPGRFYTTQSGKNAVEKNFSREITKNSGVRSVRRKRRRS